jgi:hypothetical protein
MTTPPNYQNQPKLKIIYEQFTNSKFSLTLTEMRQMLPVDPGLTSQQLICAGCNCEETYSFKYIPTIRINRPYITTCRNCILWKGKTVHGG